MPLPVQPKIEECIYRRLSRKFHVFDGLPQDFSLSNCFSVVLFNKFSKSFKSEIDCELPFACSTSSSLSFLCLCCFGRFWLSPN